MNDAGRLPVNTTTATTTATTTETTTAVAGAWIDTTSGLMWQNVVPSGQADDCGIAWQEAVDYCNDLVLDNYDDWRLPSISELRSRIRGCPATMTGGLCGVTDNCTDASSCTNGMACEGCVTYQGPDTDSTGAGTYEPAGIPDIYGGFWSSTTETYNYGLDAWNVDFQDGSVGSQIKTDDGAYLWALCVRTNVN